MTTDFVLDTIRAQIEALYEARIDSTRFTAEDTASYEQLLEIEQRLLRNSSRQDGRIPGP